MSRTFFIIELLTILYILYNNKAIYIEANFKTHNDIEFPKALKSTKYIFSITHDKVEFFCDEIISHK